MTGWHGPQRRGAMRGRRAQRRAEAEARNARPPAATAAVTTETFTIAVDESPCPSGKPAYPKREADAAAKRRTKALNRTIRAYPCDHCNGWHLTKREAS